jgi:hypothetical protein
MTDNAAAEAEIIERIDHFLLALDERRFDEVRDHFTDDVVAEYPIGSGVGIDQVLAATEAGVLRYERTQHLGTNYLVEVESAGDRAAARWNQVCHHVHPEGDVFSVGVRCRARLVRTSAGWRVNHTAMQVIWTSGRPPVVVEV